MHASMHTCLHICMHSYLHIYASGSHSTYPTRWVCVVKCASFMRGVSFCDGGTWSQVYQVVHERYRSLFHFATPRERERERESVLLGNNVHNEGFQRSAPRRGALARRAQTGRYPLPVRTSRARRAHLAFVGMFASPYVRKTNRGRRDTSATRQERQS